MDGWFPKLNARGEVASGSAEIAINGIVVGPGSGPHWVDDDMIVYGRGSETVLHDRITAGEQVLPIGYNLLTAGGRTWWGWRVVDGGAVAHRYEGVVRTATLIDVGAPKLSPRGTHVAFASPYQAETKTLVLDGLPLATDAIMDVAVSEAAVVWLVATGRLTRSVYGRLHGGAATAQRVLDWEAPQVIDGPSEPWILSGTQRGLLLRPWSSSVGYRWDGDFFNPHAVFLPTYRCFRIVASSSRGEPIAFDVAISEPRRELRGSEPSIGGDPVDPIKPEEPVPEPEPAPEPVMLPRAVIERLHQVRAQFLPIVSPREIGRILHDTAAGFPREGPGAVGAQTKDGGTMHSIWPDGTTIWNGLRWVDDEGNHWGFDVCGACAVGRFEPQDAEGGPADPRSFVRWVPGATPIIPGQPDTPGPPPPKPTDPAPDLTEMRAAMKVQDARIDEHEVRLAAGDAAQEGSAEKGGGVTSHVGRLDIKGTIDGKA